MLPLYEMQLAVFEALRRLGFAPEDIYVAYNQGTPVTILKTQGKQFVMNYPSAGIIPSSEEEYIQGWGAVTAKWNETMSSEERRRIFDDRFLLRGEAVPLLEALSRKGITWRANAKLN